MLFWGISTPTSPFEKVNRPSWELNNGKGEVGVMERQEARDKDKAGSQNQRLAPLDDTAGLGSGGLSGGRPDMRFEESQSRAFPQRG